MTAVLVGHNLLTLLVTAWLPPFLWVLAPLTARIYIYIYIRMNAVGKEHWAIGGTSNASFYIMG
jgi:hypothetical protein